MSVVSDQQDHRLPRSGARAFARLDTSETRHPLALAADPASTTVTLGKIGDFLEVDFRRLFAWLLA